MSEIASQIAAALPVHAEVKTVDMTWAGKGVSIEVYSNGDAGNTVITRHQDSDSVEAIVAAHMAARAPKSQKKSRQIARRVHREIFG